MERKKAKTSAKKKASAKSASKPKAKAETQPKAQESISLKKQYMKSRSVCKVTFILPKKAAPKAKKVAIAGDFNNWDAAAHAMKKLKSGDFTITLELEKGKNYRFRYLIDGRTWENDWCADSYVPNRYGSDDSVVTV